MKYFIVQSQKIHIKFDFRLLGRENPLDIRAWPFQ